MGETRTFTEHKVFKMKRLSKPKVKILYYTEDQLLRYFGEGRYNTFLSWCLTSDRAVLKRSADTWIEEEYVTEFLTRK